MSECLQYYLKNVDVIFINRKALLVYLQNIRDLEIAKYVINTQYKNKELQYKKNDSYYRTQANYIKPNLAEFNWEDPRKSNFVLFILIIGMVLCVLLGRYGLNHLGSVGGIFWFVDDIIGYILGYGGYFLAIVIAVLLIKCIQGTIQETKKYDKKKKEVEKYNQQEIARTEQYNMQQQEKYKNFPVLLQQNQQNWERDKSFLLAERTKVKNLLTEAYSINIIPLPYRDLAPIYYIYNYLSTSQATLEQALMHEHMERGIEKLASKMDIIIAQNAELIFNTREISNNTDRISGQISGISNNMKQISNSNIQILESCRRNEKNTEQAAQYAAIAAQYAKADAYFQYAAYLKN